MKKTIQGAAVMLLFAALNSQISITFAQGTAFTYQGRLNVGGSPANGLYDYRFKLYVDPSGSTQVGGSYSTNAIPVTNGLFITTIDFGAGIFTGYTNWLEVEVKTNLAGGYTVLSPLQRVTPTPNAIFAETAGNVSGTVSAVQLSGAVANGNLPTSPTVSGTVTAGAFAGNGASLTSVNAAELNGLNATNFWQLGGNNVSPGQFLGSTNYQAVEIWSGGNRIAHFEAVSNDVNHSSIANVINGSALNSVNAGAVGVTIAGGGSGNYYGSGGPNQFLSPSDFSTIGGGFRNLIYRQWATIGGGDNNTAGGDYSTVGGGSRNFVIGPSGSIGGGAGNTNIGFCAVISGGTGNLIPNPGYYDTLGGGLYNTNSGYSATLSGGQYNLASGYAASVAGGEYNTSGAMDSTVAGGAHNLATNNAATIGGGQHNLASGPDVTIGGGYNNNAQGESAVVGGGWFNNAGTNYATVPGGQNNAATGDTSFAAGQYAYAQHAGTFVWADGSAPGVPFISTGTNQFLIRAKGGVGINTNNPNGAALSVNGTVVATGFVGNGGGLTNLNASQLASGTIPLAQLPAAVVTNGASGVTISGSFSGNGAGVTNATASSLNGVASAVAAGYFTPASSSAVGNGLPSAYAYPGAVADVNGDGKPDLICVNFGINTLTILTNNGSGGFGSNATLFSSSPIAVAAADVNGDGKPDLISANYSGNTLTVWTNNGGGIFGSNATINVGGGPNKIIAADVNGDGKMDLVVAFFNGTTLTILTNNGSGGLVAAAPLIVAAGAASVTAADLNGDGKVDLAVVNNGAPGVLTVLTNNGTGRLVTASTTSVGGLPVSVVAADIYGNGHPALITANQADNTLTVLTNQGGGIYSSNATFHVGADPFCVTAADINADGKLDLICANQTDGTLTVLTNTGSGSFVLNATLNINPSAAPTFVAAVDVNGDGRPDLVALDYGLSAFSIFLNNSMFSTGGNAVIGGSVSAATFAGDGSGLTNVNAATLNGLSAGSFASASGSANYIQNQSAGAQLASFNISGSAAAASAAITGNAQVSGLLRSGSETGTSEAPTPAGMVVRRINSSNALAGQIVARTDTLILERDGSYGGFQVIVPPNTGNVTIACMGMDNTGAQKNAYNGVANSITTQIIQIYANSQNIVHFECTFGVTYSSGQHLTKVTLSRYANGSYLDNYWSGDLISTYNQ